MKKISIQNLGPIKEADIEFGDLTILVGPQASGKSIFLQIVKLISDTGIIHDRLKDHGYVWRNAQDLLDLFLGEGMSQIWGKHTQITSDDVPFNEESLLKPIAAQKQTIFYIPAQRVIALQNGWPRPFSDFSLDPYVLRGFSEALRANMENRPTQLLLQEKKKEEREDYMYQSIYYNAELEVDVKTHRKRFVMNIEGTKIPYMAWSAGQREFMPLWLGINTLLHVSNSDTKIVVVEEPEMGLHPAAIKQVIVKLLELIQHGYKVIISTHSPTFLEFAWAFHFLKESKAEDRILNELFDIKQTDINQELFDKIFEKDIRTYYFDKKENAVNVKDISSLDAGSDDPSIAEWGGISSFASKAADIVAKNVVED